MNTAFNIILWLLIVALIPVTAGCSTMTVTTPSGWSYTSTRFLSSAGLDDATVETPDGVKLVIKGARSDGSKLIDLAAQLAKP
jgi:hypothetical protein